MVKSLLSLQEAVGIYEKTRMPRAGVKQQSSFTLGAVYMFENGPRQRTRDDSSARSVETTEGQDAVERLTQGGNRRVEGPDPNAQSWNLWGAPENMQSIFGV